MRINAPKMPAFITAFIALVICGQVVVAQSSVYRCVDDDGSVTFSDAPCDDERERHHLRPSYEPDPNAPVIRSRPPPRAESRPQPPVETPISPTESPPVSETIEQPMATKCTSQDGRRVYYRLNSCGRSSVSIDGVTTTGQPAHGSIRLQDRAEPATYAEACSWAQRRADNTRNSSTVRRSARDFARSVCR